MYNKEKRQNIFFNNKFAIFGVLISFIIILFSVMINKNSQQARNLAVINQIFEYQTVLNIEYSQSGKYPTSGTSRTNIYCIGDGLVQSEKCMGSLTMPYDVNISSNIENVFRLHMSELPRFDQSIGIFNFSSPAYIGCIGTGITNTRCDNTDYSIWFLLEGTDKNCGRAHVADKNFYNEYTLCRLMPIFH